MWDAVGYWVWVGIIGLGVGLLFLMALMALTVMLAKLFVYMDDDDHA
jgi:hypothetical protein